MKADAIAKRILDDARLEADHILLDAEERAAEIKRKAAADTARMAGESAEQVRLESAALREEMLLMARIQQRKERLSVQRQVIDRAFQEALAMLDMMSDDQKRSFYSSVIAHFADGDETIVAQPSLAALFTRDTLRAINATLLLAGKLGLIALSGETRAQISGLILKKGGMEVNCTLPAILNSARPSIESAVAEMLFTQGGQ